MFNLNIIGSQTYRSLEELPGVNRVRTQNQAHLNINNTIQDLIIMLNNRQLFSQEQINNQTSRARTIIEGHLNQTNPHSNDPTRTILLRMLVELRRNDIRGLIQAWRDARRSSPQFRLEPEVNPEGVTGVRPICAEIARILRPMHIMLNNRGVQFTQQEIDNELNRIRPALETLFGNMARIDDRRKEAADLFRTVLFDSIEKRHVENFNSAWNTFRNPP